MTQEDKQLLLEDLCARLPYGVKCFAEIEYCNVDFDKDYDYITTHCKDITIDIHNIGEMINYIKPYLRPMSSMTEEEKKKVFSISQEGNIEYHYGVFYRCQDYLNSIYVDYRGLIEKGLALEAPNGMYNLEKK